MKSLQKTTAVCLTMLVLGNLFFPPPGAAITIREEEKLGYEFMKTVRAHFRFIEDPMIAAYVEKIGKKILSVMPDQPFPYNFYVIRQDVYNAFAGPAGNVFVNSGLMTAMDTEDELAAILAHEIIHVSARHISQKIERTSKITLASLAGIVAGIFLGIGGAGEAAQAVTMSSMAAGQTASLSYSRQDEMQADQIGIQYLTAAGYSGEGMLTILKKIRDTDWYGTEQAPSYIMTHPAVGDRIAYLGSWMESHRKELKKPGADNQEFRQVRTRLTAAYGDKDEALRKMKAELAKYPDDPFVCHGYGIALARNDNPKEGAVHVRRALQKRPFDAVMLKDLGEISFMDGQYENAMQALSGSIGIDPEDYECLFLLGRSAIELGQYREAISFLEKTLEKKPEDSQTIYYLGEAWGKQGNMAEAHYYLGKYYRNKRDFRNAIFHFRQVLKLSDDSARKADVEKMLSFLRKERNLSEEDREGRRDQKKPFCRLQEKEFF
ncbi:MAG: M48 family metalloprotease [Desulfobacterales bacterium]